MQTNLASPSSSFKNAVPDPSKVILACIDGSQVTESVCDYAAWYAERLSIPVTLLHAIDIPKTNRHDLSGTIGMDSRNHLMRELTILDEKTARVANQHGEALLKDAKTHVLEQHPNLTIFTHLRHSKLLPAIEHFANQARVIVLGRHGLGHNNDAKGHINIGSQIENAVRARHQPILICSELFKAPTTYMLAFDGSATAKRMVDMVCHSRLSQGLHGHLVMVDPANRTCRQDLQQAKEQLEQAGLSVEAHIIDAKAYESHGDFGRQDSDVVSSLIAYQSRYDIDLILIGAYGHSKLRQFFVGSTTTELLANTSSPVLLLR